MFRKSAVIAALFIITASSNLFALGLGEIDMKSALNQPMEAVIELTSAAGADLSKVNVTLASPAAHKRIGLSRSRILSNFEFRVEQDRQGNTVVRISSREAVHEPFLEFLLELSWPNGHLLREYTVLVDPPVTMPATAVTPVAPVSRAPAPTAVTPPQRRPVYQSRPAPAVVHSPAPSVATGAENYGPIRRSETLWSIAKRLRPGNGISMHQMMLALQRENPQAFIDNNINNLKAGSTLKVPSRDKILSVSAAVAYAETTQQYADWKAGVQPAIEDEPAQQSAAVTETDTASESVAAKESRLQLMAPEVDAVEGAATSGDPLEVTTDTSEPGAEMLNQQLALATEEAEASKAQSTELQSQVSELEEQIETMARLLELKDEELASMQQNLAADSVADVIEPSVTPAAEEAQLSGMDETMPVEEITTEEVAEDVAVVDEIASGFGGIVNKLMDNPLLTGAGVLVALLLGGILWSSIRNKRQSSIFDDEMTLDKRMSDEETGSEKDKGVAVIKAAEVEPESVPEPQYFDESANNDSDPLTEADVYLAYGRIQQAEDVLQAALAAAPDDVSIRVKLLEVYHAAGNAAAFDREAGDFRKVVSEDDAVWMQVASMGHALSPDNELYRAAAVHTADATAAFDMDPSDMTHVSGQEQSLDAAANDAPGSDLPNSIEFTLDESVDMLAADDGLDEEDVSEGLLSTSEEVTTKLDLARAYLDMGDPEGARSILGEVIEEGNDEQKNEAEALISKLA